MPKNVHQLRGNPSKLPSHVLTGDVEPDIEVPTCPRFLLPLARQEWRRMTPELKRLGLIAKIDRAALSLYCQEWAWFVWHDTALQRDIAIATEKKAEHDANDETKLLPWVGGDGFMIATPNGSLTYNPHWVARNKALAQLDKLLASFGLSPSSRGRVTASSKQPYLPGLEPPASGFGAL